MISLQIDYFPLDCLLRYEGLQGVSHKSDMT